MTNSSAGRHEGGLSSLGENHARSLSVDGAVRGALQARELKSALVSLKGRHRELSAKYAQGGAPEAAEEWLLDNLYLALREGGQALRDLHSAKRLPSSGGESALKLLCRALLLSTEKEVTPDGIELFFEGCQSVYVLSRRELSLLAPTLRAVIIAELAELYSSPEPETAAAKALFSGLRTLSVSDLSALLERIDRSEQLLKDDPAGLYPLMAEKTREHYKRRLERLSREAGMSEHHMAQQLLRLSRSSSGEARHIGYYLFTRPMDTAVRKRSGTLYIIFLAALSLAVSAAIGLGFESFGAAALSLLPGYALVKSLLDAALLYRRAPTHIPRMELKDGVPAEGRTLCVIAALLTDEASAASLAKRLEEHRLASRDCGENLRFGILADLPDSKAAELHTDEALECSAEAAVNALNEKYGGGFYLFLRRREYCRSAGLYMAKERKRGAVMELARLLCGKESSLLTVSGNALGLRGVRYILTLDEDTRLTPGAARELIGAMLHPLCAPVIDEERRVVVSGFGLIHPRICTELSAVNKSAFSRVFAPRGGSDPYGSDSSELYMDVFQNGGFAGKGIIDANALLRCLDGRIPRERVLSHDALEGAYLRGGFMGDAELSDGFPSGLLPYRRRAERWMRGDWQNAPWIFSRGKGLSAISRFRLFDSVRRALSPAAVLAAFFAAFFFRSPAACAAGLLALLSVSLPFFRAACRALFRPAHEGGHKNYSGVKSPALAEAVRLLYELLFLPDEAAGCLRAAVLSLWRMLISHRNMLEWTTSFALERSKSSLLRYFGAMLPALIIAAAALLSPSVLGKAAGVLWLLSPIAAFDLSRPRAKKEPLSVGERDYLLQSAKHMWRYFEELCTAREHYLPPDNLQSRPEERIAHRTSPTNIGLCLLSCLAAVDMELTPRQNALGLVENILATLRRMPKWNGNLYNWYDTETLRPLHPAYVSAVDCGNLVACLIVLRQGLCELSQQHLADECEKLCCAMSLAPFYDESRSLLSIGYDAEKGCLSSGCYDLMASEAQITSFVAIARGDVPKKHWRQLSRALCAHGGYQGMASWTGSMFEYMMPRLFFAFPGGSLMYESTRFCVGVQMDRTKASRLPWGVSESAYYSLDAALSYRYKAHGCAALALKRGMDLELVVSPYSSFLALPCAPKSAIDNLRALEKRGMSCAYGFWEALDLTPGRCDKPGGQTVRCVMAHHVGMSIVACANALRDDIMPRRLMAVPEMSAYSCLLQEKLPARGIVLQRREARTVQKPPRCAAVYWEKRGDFADFASPACCVLSNGVYSLLLTDSGRCRALYRGLAPYCPPEQLISSGHGVGLYLQRAGTLTPLLPTPDMPQKAQSDWEFTPSGAKISTSRDGLRSQVVFSVAPEISGEKRVISVSGGEGEEETARLILTLRPSMLSEREYASHPAFAQLGLHAKMRGGALILRRLPRGGAPELFMCLAASAPLECSARGELIPGRGGLLPAIEQNLPSPLGWLSSPFVCAALPIRVAQGADSAVSLAIAVSGSENEAYSGACRLLAGDAAVCGFGAETASRLRMSESELSEAMELLPALCFPRPSERARRELWSFGISGDRPVIVRPVSSEAELPAAESQIKMLRFLRALGFHYDLVFLCDEGGDYLRPVSAALTALRQSLAEDGSGIRIIQRDERSALLLELSAQPRERKSVRGEAYSLPDTLFAPIQSAPEYSWLSDDSFRFRVSRSLPKRTWSNVLSNGRFGALASDCGTGYMWYKNAREYAIGRRPSESRAYTGGEVLQLEGKSLFATPFDEDCLVSFAPGEASWEKCVGSARCTVAAFVPPDTDARVLIVQWNDGERKALSWQLDLVLGGGEAPDGLSVSALGGVFRARSASAPFDNADLIVFSDSELTGFTGSREAYLRGDYNESLAAPDCLALRFEADSPFVLVCGCDTDEKLLALRSPAAALAALERTREHWRQRLSAVKIETPLPALDRLVNTWLPYQALCCRLMARCSMYQSGGAFGFRDQLQDAVNLIMLDPSLAREQILCCCRHQYTDGDVMHWWHALEHCERGVRTRCTDDLLWLTWALCEYCEKTGDTALCHEGAPWLVSRPLEAEEHDRYEQAVLSPLHSSVTEHAKKALELMLLRGTGSHGLLKIGGGDWNDGFSRVGSEGEGESVWLTQFFADTARRFSALLRSLGESAEAESFEASAVRLARAADGAWDGQWYLRGFFDDGTPLGSSEAAQCKIDSLAQSFAALCIDADENRVSEALSSALSLLFDEERSLIKLFDPPFEDTSPDPGYISSYGPGFRENGGQYTHAAVWLIMALLRQNRRSEALLLLKAVIPELHESAVYEAEPFVLSADVYSNPDCIGRAGWSWYTGAAGWLYRVVIEELFGLRLKGGALTLSPRIPAEWGECRLRCRSPDGAVTDIVASGASAGDDKPLTEN